MELNIMEVEKTNAPTQDELETLADDFYCQAREMGLTNDCPEVFSAAAMYYARIAAHLYLKKTKTYKGLFIFGNTGSGKSELAKCIVSTIRKRVGKRSVAVWRNVMDYAGFHARYSYPDWLEYEADVYGKRITVIDDFGQDIRANNYGNPFDIFPVIDMRYKMLKQHGAITIITCNIERFNSIETVYSSGSDAYRGKRLKSRIAEMCDFLRYDRSDRRMADVKLLNE